MTPEPATDLTAPAITGATRLAGIIGDPIGHSRSPRMHNAAFRALKLDWAYVPFHVRADGLEAAVRGLKALGVAGFNVTIPHKETVIPLMDTLSPAARVVGAVNTVRVEDGRLAGHNTDGEGFSRALRETQPFDAAQSPALVLGAGGAARAVCDQLAREGVPAIRICNRTQPKAKALAEHIRRHHPDCDVRAVPWTAEEKRAAVSDATIIVNATAVGLDPGDASPLDTDGVGPGHIVVDLIYAPRETDLLRRCRPQGARCLNGQGMLLHQGAAAFTLWTGREAPLEVMRRALEAP